MILLKGIIGEQVTLANVVASVNADTDPILQVHINSIGGDVGTGIAIYEYLRNYKERPVYTYAVEECMSIASIIFLAGSRRFAGCPIMIHLPMITPEEGDHYNTEDLTILSAYLQDVNKRMIKIYKEVTGADEKTLELLMKETSYIAPKEAITLGFAHETTAPRALAIFNINNKNLSEMAKKTMKEIIASAKALAKAAGEFLTPDVKAMDITDVNGQVLSVTREEGEPQVGDAASPDGIYTLEDGRTITVAGGVITEIMDPVIGEEEMEALRAENEQLRNSVAELTAALGESVTAMEEAETELTDLRARAQKSAYKAPVRTAGKKDEGKNQNTIIEASRARVQALREGKTKN